MQFRYLALTLLSILGMAAAKKNKADEYKDAHCIQSIKYGRHHGSNSESLGCISFRENTGSAKFQDGGSGSWQTFKCKDCNCAPVDKKVPDGCYALRRQYGNVIRSARQRKA